MAKAPEKDKQLTRIFAIGGGIFIALLIALSVLLSFWTTSESPQEQAVEAAPEVLQSYYVVMPQPFDFNINANDKIYYAQIKIHLKVQGQEAHTATSKHIPLLQDALLTTLSNASFEDLMTVDGKRKLRKLSLQNVQNSLHSMTGRRLVDKVLFTGFILQ